ncbi:MAG: GNAT family N-acetyltransferase [Anaerolineales bacterium]
MIQTPRLSLFPLTYSQLKSCLSALPSLEAELGFALARDAFDEEVTRAIGIKLSKMESLPLELHPWQTYWLVVISESDDSGQRGGRTGAGLIGFKGYLNTLGEAEVGYGIAPPFQGRGYTTEALRALCTWAFRDPACRAIKAVTVLNPASNRVLHKVGAQIFDAREGKMDWKIYRLGFQPLGEIIPF